VPLYEYQCEACGERFEVIQKFSDPHTDTCRKCGKGPVQKLMSSPAIQFKGSGFYITDYAKGKSSDSGGSPKKADKDTPAGETKSESKTESKSEPAKSDSPKTESTPAKSPGTS
jgi:putative FmdB family regulatory protein